MMSQCCGTVVIAFERMHIAQGTERRGTSEEKRLDDIRTPTVWNQIEAGMAYQRGHPLLVIVENSLREEGLRGYDWWVQSVPLGPAALQRNEFAGVFADWKRRVEDFAGQKVESSSSKVDVDRLTVVEIVRALTPAQLWSILLAIGILLAATAGLAFKLGMIAGTRGGPATSVAE
jgi:hypothetical protein